MRPQAGQFDVSDKPVAPAALGEQSGDLNDGFGIIAIAESHAWPMLWVSGLQGGGARCLAP